MLLLMIMFRLFASSKRSKMDQVASQYIVDWDKNTLAPIFNQCSLFETVNEKLPSAGVATMKKGEKAVFTIRSDYAYGAEGSGDKIPGTHVD